MDRVAEVSARKSYQFLTLAAAFAFASCACNGSSEVVSPASKTVAPSPLSPSGATAHIHTAAPAEDNGLIDGWFEGATVQLFYTKSYFCAEPPSSGAPSDCEIGAPAEVPPREGPIPTIYAIVPSGFAVDPSTLACPGGSTCLDHPAMIDASRIRPGATSVPGLPHSHIVDQRHAGWHLTVNIRVFSSSAWDEIVAAKSLTKVRELQGDPMVGRPGVISADTPTNVYFFIASWRN